MIIKILFSLIIMTSSIFAGVAKITAAADLIYAFTEMKSVFEKQNPGDKILISFGSSGKAYTQIINGAPYDMYFSANMKYVQNLEKEGFTATKPKTYAYGRIGLWLPKDKNIILTKGMSVLLDSRVKKIAIANPEHAPYGVAAVDALKNRKYYEKIKDKIVIGENVSQTAQFVQSGAADIGIIPISLALSKKLKKLGNFYLFPANWHNAIIQGYALLKHGKDNQTAKKFENFVSSKEAREIFNRYGFKLPNE